MVRQVIKAAGLAPATAVFALLFVVATLVAAAVEPGIGNIGDAAWFYFTVVTTIGLGDFTCVTLVGRLTTVALSFYSVFYLAVITGAVVSYCSEVMQARQNESIAQFLDKLERLPELSHEELVAISERIRRL
jgi:voltage-gated potassium channel